MRLTVVALLAGLAIGIAAGLSWPEPEPPLRELERRVTARARAEARAGRIDGPILRSTCSPVRATPNRFSCVAVQWQTKLGYGGLVYMASRNRRGRWRISRFDIPIEWGV